VVHVRLTRRDRRGDVLEVTRIDRVTFAVTEWKQQHPDIAVGTPTAVAEDLDAYAEIPVSTVEAAGLLAGFVAWMTEAPTHVHDHDDTTSLPGALRPGQFAALVPGSPVEFLLEGTWYPGDVRLTDLTDADGDPMLIVSYTGEQTPNSKIRKGHLDPGDGFPVYAGEVRPRGAAGQPVTPPRPTVHLVGDALIRVHGATPDTNDASDTYAIEIDGVKILFQLVAADDDTDSHEPEDGEPAVYVRVDNVARPKGTHLVVDVNGTTSDYRF
jgi:hypothetical protein